MTLLLIVGTANDIFIYNYAKWLKASMDVTIDVFEFYPSDQQGYGNEYYGSVTSAKGCGVPVVRRYIDSYLQGYQLKKFIKDKQYDIIHCHWVVAPLVLVKGLKSHCRKLVVTFWGREYANMSLLGSKKRFRKHLDVFMDNVDALINSRTSEQHLKSQLSTFNGGFYGANLGSSPLEALYKLMEEESKDDSKLAIGMPTDKVSVLIGYSGKSLHQHIPVIEELRKHVILKDKLHLLVPMTRGGSDEYIEKVRQALGQSGFTYTLLSGRFLSDTEIAQIRNATDITLQLSTTDGFSRSIIECLCAKSLMIYGDWLGYERYLVPAGFQAFPTNSIEEGIRMIPKILNEIDVYNNMFEANYRSGENQYLWSKCIIDWVNAYNDLLK